MIAEALMAVLTLAAAREPKQPKCPPVGLVPSGKTSNGAAELIFPTADLKCLIGALSDADPGSRLRTVGAIDGLATLRYKNKLQRTDVPLGNAVPALESVLDDKHDYIRTAAAVAIAKIKPNDPRILPILMQALNPEPRAVGTPSLYISAAIGLGHMGKNAKAAVPELLKAPDSDEFRLRLYAAEALIEIDPSVPKIVEMLKSCLRSPHGGVRDATVDAFRKLGPRAAGAVPALISILEHGSGDEVPAAELALGAIGPKANEAVPALARNSGGLAVPSLVEIGSEDAFKALTSMKNEQSARSALTAMIQHDKRKWVERFVKTRGGPNWKDDLGRTPLHDCAAFDRPEIAKLVLRMGADLNAVYKTGGLVGGTPLHDAVRYHKRDMARFLVQSGADKDVKAYDGTPRDIAAKNKDKEILAILGEK